MVTKEGIAEWQNFDSYPYLLWLSIEISLFLRREIYWNKRRVEVVGKIIIKKIG
jgi:hypothetical protein